MKRFLFVSLLPALFLSLFSCNKEGTTKLKSLSFEKASMEMAVGDQRYLLVIASPSEANAEVKLSSSDPSIVRMDDEVAVALKEGTAVITARSGDIEAQCTITVVIPVEKLAFATSSLVMKVNDEKEAEVTVSPSNASNLKVEFEIGDPSVVNLDNLVRNGEKTKVTVIAVGRGQTIVTAKCGKRRAHLYVYVEYDDIKVTGLTVNPSTLSLKTAETRQLTTSVTPAGAASLPVSWISTNPDVVSVQDGLVTAEKPGSTNVWAYCGDQSAFCTVTVGAPEGGVDLGLSVCWAECNLGASVYYLPGNYYAWGELTPKSTYTWSNYQLREGGSSFDDITFKCYNTTAKYGKVDNKISFEDYDYRDDAARHALGGKWRVPSCEEFKELIDNTTIEYFVLPSLGRGFKLTSTVPGYTDRSIFLPIGTAVITNQKEELYGAFGTMAMNGFYWMSGIVPSSPYCGSTAGLDFKGSGKEPIICLNAGNGFDTHNGFIYSTSMRGFYREWGLNIRPVW